MSFSRTVLLGNAGRDPEIRTMQSGDKVASFSIATSETWKDKATGEKKETTEWHNIVCFNQNIIPVIERYVQKGTKVLVEGQNKTRKWEKDGQTHYSTEVVIGRFNGSLSLEGGPKGGERDEHAYGETRTKEAARQPPPPRSELDDDIPF